MTDLVDALVGIAPGSALDAIRARRPVVRTETEASYRALFTPADPGDFSLDERFALGAFVTGLHGDGKLAAHYAAQLPSLAAAISAAVAANRADGPHGSFPPGPLSAEDTPPPRFVLSDDLAATLGPRLAAAFAHAQFLVFHPRDAAPDRLRPLIEAGWSTNAIVTLSQIVAFLAYQIRVVAGLSVLARHV